MIIYCVQNLITGKKYIGKHKHCSSNEEFQKSDYWGGGKYLWNSINKHGLQNFRKWVLIHCDEKDWKHYEKLWIKKLNTLSPNGYNLGGGGEGLNDPTGIIAKQISKTLTGRKQSKELIEKRFAKIIGRKQTKIQIEKRAQKLKGQKRTPEQKKKMSTSHLGQPAWNCGIKMTSEAATKNYENLKKWHDERKNSGLPHNRAGVKARPETIEKMKKWHADRLKQGILPPRSGKKHTPETIEKMKLYWSNKRLLKENLKKFTKETPVFIYNMNGGI